MPAPATLVATVTLPAPAVYATKAGHITAKITDAYAAVTAESGLAAVKTGVS